MTTYREDPYVVELTGPSTLAIGQAEDGSVTVSIIPDVIPGVVSDADRAALPAALAGDAGATPRELQRRAATAGRSRPQTWTPTDVLLVAGCAGSAALVVGLLLNGLGHSPGWFADVVAWLMLTLAMVFFATYEQMGRLAATDRVMTLLVVTGAAALVLPLASLLIYVLARGLPNLRIGFFLHDLGGVTPNLPATAGGGLHAIVGTLEQAGIALCLVIPLGMTTAVYLNETRSALRRPIRIVVDAMSGLPSIVAGLFIYSALIIHRPAQSTLFSFNGLMASLALSLVMLPTVTRTIEVVLRLVPAGLREASLALGASRTRTVWSVVLPTARSGITTAVVLGLARIVGETAPLLFTSFGNTLINSDPTSGPQESLPLFVYRLVKSPSRNESDRGYVGAVVLILVVLTLFTIARALARPRRPRQSSRSRTFPTSPDRATTTMAHLAEPTSDQPRPAELGDLPASDETVLLPIRLDDPGQLRLAPRPLALIGGPPLGAAALEATGVHAWFGDRLVLEDVDLVMPANHVTALIGPSGCGKSTFLRILNRMHELVPSASLSGQVLLDDDDIYAPGMRSQKVRSRIGMVFQKPNPFPAMSIRDNVLSGLKLGGIRCTDPDELVEQSLVRAGLWREVRDRLDAQGGALSGGQQQRLCIARALAVRPNVLLMDEPCSALDPTSTRRIEETIAELSADVTVVIVTHNMQQAQRVSDYCAFFLAAENQPGVVVEHGSTEDMFNHPADPRTLDYVRGRFG